MKKWILTGLMTMVFWNGAFQVQAHGLNDMVRATWLWDAASLQESPQETLDFLKQKNINTVHLQIDASVPANVYSSFIEKANASGIRVTALDGAPDWAAPGGSQSLASLIDWIVQFQEQHPPSQQFSGIHLDVEPYLYHGWHTQQEETIERYQEVLLEALQAAHSLALPLEADLPFWFDEVPYDNRYGTGNLAEWAISRTDGVTLMAYRNAAAAITKIAEPEISLGSTYRKPVIIGVETMHSLEGDHLSFEKRGEAYMAMQLQMVAAYYAAYKGFGGMAIHHVDSWKSMRP